MKCSTTMAILCCGALALAVTGCKYDDPSQDDLNAGTQDVVTEGSEADDNKNAASDIDTANDPNADETSLSSVTGLPFDQDPNFARCTDVDFSPVYFGFDVSQLAPSELAKVEAVARHLQEKPGRVVIVEGNCDERGSNEYNMSLGEDRAIIISNFLAQNGIARERMETISRGETNPAAEGTGESVWSQNRRGEFVIWKK